jgi:hypothetical protein
MNGGLVIISACVPLRRRPGKTCEELSAESFADFEIGR